MRNSIESLQEESMKLTLDERERQSMRESLLAYMEKNPVREQSAEQSAKSHSSNSNGKINWPIVLLVIGIVAITLILLLR
jgi:hypothetical protein